MNVIEVQAVTKTYRAKIGRARIREMLPPPIDRGVSKMFPRWWVRDTFNALEDASFSVSPGTSTGLIGHNGAGKTTLLKVIAGITAPTLGEVRVSGRIAALIDLSVGFNPDLTGRENVFLLGALHGIGRADMRERLDRIFDFAGIEDDLIETPVKRFSAGMMARLGFAVVAALDTEILLVDEVLAVGDTAFQRKCIDWIDGYRERGGTLVFVSHNLGLIRNMTEHVVWLEHGHVVQQGSPREVLGDYVKAMEHREPGAPAGLGQERKVMRSHGLDRWGAGGLRVGEVNVSDPAPGASALDIDISYENASLGEAVFCVGFTDEGGVELGAAASALLPVGKTGVVRCRVDPIPFRPGIYFPVVAALAPDGTVCDRWKLDRAIVVQGNGHVAWGEDLGPVSISSSWTSGA